MNKSIRIEQALSLLELPQNSLAQILQKANEGDPELAQQLLIRLKLKVRKQRRVLARKYHPDINPNSDSKMKIINRICDDILKARLMFPQPIVEYVYHYHTTTVHYSTTTDNLYTTGYYS